ncbi:MAG: hypothetical protein Q8830_03605, partial [Candidatus Phytoplasma australasiaticum]|nr:hypothetical protein [Candidatus Phytoplasma australasiaticum]
QVTLNIDLNPLGEVTILIMVHFKFFYYFQSIRTKVASNLTNFLKAQLVNFSYLSRLVGLHNKQTGQAYIFAKLVILWESHTLLVNKLGIHRNQNKIASLHIRKK